MTFGAGALSRTISVVVTGEVAAELDETLFFDLSGPVNAAIADARGVGTILDDDSLVVDDVSLAEGDSIEIFGS